MIGKTISSCIKRYSELFLYLLLLSLLVLHKVFNLPNISLLVLFSPLLFKDFKLLDRWFFLWLFCPFGLFTGYKPTELLNLALSAFAEELFFRAYLMQRYSNLMVSFMFSLAHMVLNPSLLSTLTFFPSLLFGYAYKRTNSINFATFLHLWSNLFYWFLGFVQ